jgi:hypothetical protein
MIKQYIIKNPVIASIVLFSVLFFTLQLGKPRYIYNQDGSLKIFGVAYKKKTVFPLWLLTIAMAILSYIFVRYCTTKFIIVDNI